MIKGFPAFVWDAPTVIIPFIALFIWLASEFPYYTLIPTGIIFVIIAAVLGDCDNYRAHDGDTRAIKEP